MVWHTEPLQLKDENGNPSGKWRLVAHSDEGGGFHECTQKTFNSPEEAANDRESRIEAGKITGIPDRDLLPTPANTLITEDWLKQSGFTIAPHRADERTEPTARLRRLAIAHHANETTAFVSSDGLCIDIAPNPIHGNWYVWLHQEEPYRFLHVRMMRYQGEVIALYEGLTGKKWDLRSN